MVCASEIIQVQAMPLTEFNNLETLETLEKDTQA